MTFFMPPPRLTMTYHNQLLQDPPPLQYRIKKVYQFHDVIGTRINHFVAKSHRRKSAVLRAQTDPAPKPQVFSASTATVLPKLTASNTQPLFPKQLHRACASGPHTPPCSACALPGGQVLPAENQH